MYFDHLKILSCVCFFIIYIYTYVSGFILSTFLGPLYGKNTQSSIEFWNSISKTKNFFVQLNQHFIVYMLKRKLAVFHCLFIFSPFNIQDERWNIYSNCLPTKVKDVFTNAIRCIKRLKNAKLKTNFGNSKRAKKIKGAYSPTPQTPSWVLSLALCACSLRNSIFYTKNG